eukprot:TRINITY_DN5431_c0_g1_i1.p1 TRINITY_DN5431_c0_g1~~TRINITY_DN5431_c0_g1_i1.p1  ORF type:complete len:474 (+),score=123.02 TRINITY_DN5431_c0_g1_i1:99-1424(+)
MRGTPSPASAEAEAEAAVAAAESARDPRVRISGGWASVAAAPEDAPGCVLLADNQDIAASFNAHGTPGPPSPGRSSPTSSFRRNSPRRRDARPPALAHPRTPATAPRATPTAATPADGSPVPAGCLDAPEDCRREASSSARAWAHVRSVHAPSAQRRSPRGPPDEAASASGSAGREPSSPHLRGSRAAAHTFHGGAGPAAPPPPSQPRSSVGLQQSPLQHSLYSNMQATGKLERTQQQAPPERLPSAAAPSPPSLPSRQQVQLRAARRACRRQARSCAAALHGLHRVAELEQVFPLVRWGRRMPAEPMLFSGAACALPALRLWWGGWSVPAAVLMASSIAAALYHFDGERRRWLHLQRACPLFAAAPLMIAVWLLRVRSWIAHLLILAAVIATSWCFRACGPPGTFPYEKYHLVMHWVYAGGCLAAALASEYAAPTVSGVL